MPEIKKYIGYAIAILTALFLGRWYAKERDKLIMKGEPWVKSWLTLPGLIIIIILGVLIFLKIKSG